MVFVELEAALKSVESVDAQLTTENVVTELVQGRVAFSDSLEQAAQSFRALGIMPEWFYTLAKKTMNISAADLKLQSREDLLDNLQLGMQIGVVVLSRLAHNNESLKTGLEAFTFGAVGAAISEVVDTELIQPTGSAIKVAQEYPIFGTIPTIVDTSEVQEVLDEFSDEPLDSQAMDVTWGTQLCFVAVTKVIASGESLVQ
jgi:hypothetical protein